MPLKQKLLEALGEVALDSLDEELLLEMLLADRTRSEKRIAKQQAEKQKLYDSLQRERDQLRAELFQMRNDPLYGAYGRYAFIDTPERVFIVDIQGSRQIQAVRRQLGVDYVLQQIPLDALEARTAAKS